MKDNNKNITRFMYRKNTSAKDLDGKFHGNNNKKLDFSIRIYNKK